VRIYQRPVYLRQFKKLNAEQQAEVRAVALRLPEIFGRPHLHVGAGLRPFGRFFEFRAGLDLRVHFSVEGGDAHLETVGNHDAIRAFVKNHS
jgi:hypothetical protein